MSGKKSVNKNNRSMNAATSEFSSVLSQLKRIRNTPGAAESRFTAIQQRREEELDWVEKRGIDSDQVLSQYRDEIAEIAHEIEDAKRNVSAEKELRQKKYETSFVHSMSSFASKRSSNIRIHEKIEDEKIKRHSTYNAVNQSGYGALSTRYEAATQRLEGQRDFFNELTNRGPDKTPSDVLARAAKKIQGTEQEIAGTSYSMERMRVEHKDPLSIQTAGDKIQNRLQEEREINSGRTGEVSKEKAFANIVAARIDLDKTAEKFKQSMDKAGKASDELTSAYKKAQENFISASNVAKGAGVNASGIVDSRGSSNIWTNLASLGVQPMIQAIGGVFSEISKTASFASTTARNVGKTGTAYAGLINDRGQDIISSVEGGDYSAARRLLFSYDKAVKSGDKIKSMEEIAFAAGVTSDAAASTANAIGAGVSGNEGIAAIEAMKGAGDLVRSYLYKDAGLVGTAADIDTQKMVIARDNAINKMRDINAQFFGDTAFGTGKALTGLGMSGGQTVDKLGDELINVDTVTRLAKYGIAAEDLPGLTQMGVGALGKQFSTGMLNTAGRVQQAQIMGKEQYIQAAGALTDVGGKDRNLEGIIKMATKGGVMEGMDSSKNIEQMVQATIAVSSQLSAKGLETVGGASALLGAGVGAVSNLPENMRVGVAKNALDFVQGATGDTGYNIYNVIRAGQARKLVGTDDMGLFGRMNNITAVESQDFLRLAKTDEKAAVKEAERLGILFGVTDKKTGKLNQSKVKGLEDMLQTSVFTRLSGFGYNDKAIQEETWKYMKGDVNFENLTPESRQAVNQAGFRNQVSGKATFDIAGSLGKTPAEGEINEPTKGSKSEEIAQKDINKAESQAKRFFDGAKALTDSTGNLTSAMKTWNDTMSVILKSTDWSKIQDNAAQAANDFTIPTSNLKEAAKTFDVAVGLFASTMLANPNISNKDKATLKSAQDDANKAKTGAAKTG